MENKEGREEKEKREVGEKPGDDLLSHARADAVSSALGGFPALFGMGRRVSPPVWSPSSSILNQTQKQKNFSEKFPKKSSFPILKDKLSSGPQENRQFSIRREKKWLYRSLSSQKGQK